jgi:hypothetical protein
MTAPVSSFSKLSLSHSSMQSSRGHARGQPSGSGDESASSDDGLSHVEDDDDEVPLVDRIFALDHCRPHGMSEDGWDPSSPRYAFQIAEAQVKRYGVRISAANPRITTCSCNEAGICRHGRWLLKQLDRTGLQVGGGADRNLFQYIDQTGLGNVCEDLHWELRGGSSNSESGSDSGEPEDREEQKWELKKKLSTLHPSRHTRRLMKERSDVVRDIMATLYSEPTEDYRPDIFEAVEDITLAPVAVPGDVGGTFSRWLLQDDDSLSRFKPFISQDMRASAYFKSMDRKAHKACELMDRYAQIGPSPDEKHHDVAWCAQELVDIVNSVGKNIMRRQPLGPSSRREASKTLVSILQEVVDRNKDVYQDDRLPRRRPHGEPQTNRNLYQRLIGSNSPSNPAGPMFILRELQDLPEAQPFVELLQEVLGKLRTIGWGPAPQTFQEKLRTIITQLKGSPEPISSTGTRTAEKRRASLMDRKNKRMK